MGYIKHNAIIVSGWDYEKQVKPAHDKAIEIFERHFADDVMTSSEPWGGRLISEILHSLSNGQVTFFIAPDGSKEGWETSDKGNAARKEFLDWLMNQKDNYCDYVEVRFGGDDSRIDIVRDKDSDVE